MPKTMNGSLAQLLTNTTISQERPTGALQSLNQAILPLFIRLEIDPLQALSWVAPYAFEVIFKGTTSGVALKWQIANVVGGILDTNLEWNVPNIYEPLFDETVTIQIRSAGLAALQVITCNYVMYYEIKQMTELQLVQAIESYPVGVP